MDKKCVNFLYIIFLTIVCAHSQEIEGDACFHNRLKKSGTCKLIFDCGSEYSGLQEHKLPEGCGFNGTGVIVCCPKSDSIPTNIISRTQTRGGATESAIPSSISFPSSKFNYFYGPPYGIVGRKSYDKCREYAKFVNVSYVVPGFTKLRYRNDCGFIPSKLILGGTKVKTAKEFPHMASIFYETNNTYGCGGSLISEYFVLSAAHCTYRLDLGEAKFVRLGDLNLISNEDDAAPENFTIIQTIKHPEYHRKSKYNDIVLFKLDRKVTFNAYVRPICLPVYKRPPTEKAIATGWGKYSVDHDFNSDVLLKVTLEFYTQNNCKTIYGVETMFSRGIVEDLQICAGAEMKDTCNGDSGGPLQIYHEDPEAYCMYMLIGVTSFGRICALPPPQNSTGVYTRVQHYLEWIESKVWP